MEEGTSKKPSPKNAGDSPKAPTKIPPVPKVYTSARKWGTVSPKMEGDRLRSLRPSIPDISSPSGAWPTKTLGGAPKPIFIPNINVKKKEKSEEPSSFSDVHMTDVEHNISLNEQKPLKKTEKFDRNNQKPRVQKPTARVVPTNESPFMSGPPANASKDKKGKVYSAMTPLMHKPKVEHAEHKGIDPSNVSHPVILPFQDHSPESNLSIPQILIDAENHNDQLFFLQLPSFLPVTTEIKDTDSVNQVQGSTLKGIGAGYAGKLQIFKSGKMKIKLGDVTYDIVSGTKCGFLQEAAVIDPETNQSYILGEVSHRMICCPDVKSMLGT